MIKKSEVEHISELAKLHLTEKEKEIFAHQFTEILNYFEKLKEIAIERVEPLSHIVDIHNPTREDREQKSLQKDISLHNAPQVKNGYFKVPKVV